MLKAWFLVVGVVGFVCASTVVQAKGNDGARVRTLLTMIDQGRLTEAKALAQKSDSVVKALYEWQVLSRPESEYPFSRYQAFLSIYGDWPSARRIRAQAERVMPDSLEPQTIVSFYQKADPASAKGADAYVRALQALGRDEQARQFLNTWFVDVNLMPEEQNQILKAFRPLVSDQTFRRRIDYLVRMGRGDQAEDLGRILGPSYRALVAARIALSDQSKKASILLAQVPLSLQSDPGLLYERLRFRRRDDQTDAMFELFQSLPEGFRPDDPRAFWSEQQILAQRLMDVGRCVDAYRVAARPVHDDRFARGQANWYAGYIALSCLKQPGRAFRHFEGLYRASSSPLTRARAAFWAGEASVGLGYPEVAQAWYRTASVYRANFYGQLAATRIPAGSLPPRALPPQPTQDDQRIFQKLPMVQMAQLLHAAGHDDRAALFLNRLADVYKGQGQMIRQTVDLALSFGMTSVAVKMSRAAGIDGVDFSDYVFPVLKHVKRDGLDPALVHAIIRQESAFDEEAISSAGARGLMQLMPTTAKHVAKQTKQNHKQDWLTSRPQHNILLGTAYIGDLVRSFEGSYPLAIAAYNAGPSRVRKWLTMYGDPRKGDISWIDWIERIPVYETRNYVQRVLEGAIVYRRRLATSGAALTVGSPLDLK